MNANTNKSELKEALLAAISEELDQWLDKESTIDNGYDYEDEFIKTSRTINRILFSKSLGAPSCDRNKKTTHLFWEV